MGRVQQNVSAILHMGAFEPGRGQRAGRCFVRDYNPAGRLSTTWIGPLNDLPPMVDYDVRKGRTYQYSKGQLQYPFGFGLSYTTCEYSNLRTSADSVNAAGEISVSVDVKNTGTRAGDEVVQMYVKHLNSSVDRPVKEENFVLVTERRRCGGHNGLKGSDLGYWDADQHRFVAEPGKLSIMPGRLICGRAAGEDDSSEVIRKRVA